MKRKYKILICTIIIELLSVLFLRNLNVSINSWIVNAFGTLIFFLPILFLLFNVSKDKEISEKKRIIAKVFFYFIIFSWVLGGVITFFVD